MTVPVPLDPPTLLTEHYPWRDRCGGCDEAWPCSVRILVEALRIAVDTLKVVAADGAEYWRCDNALAAVRELVDLGEKP